MAIISNQDGSELIYLRSIHRFGRSESRAQLALQLETHFHGYSISRLHATIRWTGTQWLINDNNSTNGTLLNGKPIVRWTLLSMGDVIQFSDSEDWQVVNVSPPVTALIPKDRTNKRIELTGMHEFELDNGEKMFIYPAGDGIWVLANAHSEKPLQDQDSIVLANQSTWTFQLEKAEPATVKNLNSKLDTQNVPLALTFKVSADEEHTFLTVQFNQQQLDLGERVTHYLLLLLARQKIADAHDGQGDDDCGWITMEALQKMMGLDYSHLNTYLWRAKKQLEELLHAKRFSPLPDSLLFERRVGSVRLTPTDIDIIRSGKLESRLGELKQPNKPNTPRSQHVLS